MASGCFSLPHLLMKVRGKGGCQGQHLCALLNLPSPRPWRWSPSSRPPGSLCPSVAFGLSTPSWLAVAAPPRPASSHFLPLLPLLYCCLLSPQGSFDSKIDRAPPVKARLCRVRFVSELDPPQHPYFYPRRMSRGVAGGDPLMTSAHHMASSPQHSEAAEVA